MPQMNRDQRNAAWQAAHQFRARATRTQPNGVMGSLKLLFTWLAFGLLMIVGVVLGLFFLLVGWAMMPFVRHKMKKRMEQMRAQQAQDIGGSRSASSAERGRHDVLEGQYEIKNEAADRTPNDRS
ncbi:hypothetical protein LPL18_013935 [Halomonas sp. CUBES01]|uniref:Uncharacterized protein n=1 Tax=Vreelandella gomseomensis TaxID=370766 RepID=A0ABU1G859_9GAMM|nr:MULTISPECIES: hypothetical protein [Halomonas]MDR5873673.1 hypothetical protein [Halomonas gomseomensis]MEC4768426.1 hypothetical protein [Halomonas sp. CUBES01]